jgi:hypothetical protein
MNVQLRDITVTARDGRVNHLDLAYIRGSHVRFFIVPDMLRYARIFFLREGTRIKEGTRTNNTLGMLPCSDRGQQKAEVSEWLEEELRCREHEVEGVQGADEHGDCEGNCRRLCEVYSGSTIMWKPDP